MSKKIKTTPTIDIEDLSLEELIELREYTEGEITERRTTKKKVDGTIEKMRTFSSINVVFAGNDGSGLPNVKNPNPNDIYTVLISSDEKQLVFNDYVYLDGKKPSWELVGTKTIDLSDGLDEKTESEKENDNE